MEIQLNGFPPGGGFVAATLTTVPIIDAAQTNNPTFRTNDRFGIDVAFRMSGPPRMCDVRP